MENRLKASTSGYLLSARSRISTAAIAALSSLILLGAVGAQRSLPFSKRAASIGLRYVTDIPLPGGTSRFDYQAIDPVHHRLYISHMGANLVTVFNLDTRTVAANIDGIPRPTGVLAVPELNLVYVSSSSTNKVYVIDAMTLKIFDKIPTKRFPDGMTFDPYSHEVFVSNELGRAVTVFDAHTDSVRAFINVGGEVGNTHFDPVSGMVFTTDQTHDDLVTIDPTSLKIVDRYKLPGCSGPHGFCIDPDTHFAFITGEDNATFVLFDISRRKIIQRGKVGTGPDVIALNSNLHRVYVASESGIVSAFRIGGKGVKKIGESFFAGHAHTVSVDEATNLYFFALQDVGGRPVLRVMAPI